MKACLRHAESEATPDRAEIGHIPKSCGRFSLPLCYVSVVVALATASSAILAGRENLLAKRGGRYFEMGSNRRIRQPCETPEKRILFDYYGS